MGLNNPFGSLQSNDIEGSQPNGVKFKTKRQPQNPLCPVYKLAEVVFVAPDPPKFIRDAMAVSDIEGAKPKKAVERATRDNYNCGDIDGAKPKFIRERKEIHD